MSTERKTSHDYANAILDHLKQNHQRSFSTRNLSSHLEIPATSNDTLLKTLHRLQTAGKIKREGSGKFFWKINVHEWDRDDPFHVEHSGPAPIALTNGDSSHLEARVASLESLYTTLQTGGSIVHEFKRYEAPKITLKDVILPKVFEEVKTLAECRRSILLVGPAGCGKTFLAELIARTMDLDFSYQGLSGGVTENRLLGRAVQNIGKGTTSFQTTDLLERYEKGGVMLLDELDASDPNVLLCVNGITNPNGCLSVPDRTGNTMARRHKDFILVATANTMGRGATRTYAGRNQLDEATLDRFRIGTVECDYDASVEAKLCPDGGLRQLLQDIRGKAQMAGLRRIVSTRFLEDAYVMHTAGGWDRKKIVRALTSGWNVEELKKVGLEA